MNGQEKSVSIGVHQWFYAPLPTPRFLRPASCSPLSASCFTLPASRSCFPLPDRLVFGRSDELYGNITHGPQRNPVNLSKPLFEPPFVYAPELVEHDLIH